MNQSKISNFDHQLCFVSIIDCMAPTMDESAQKIAVTCQHVTCKQN